MLKKILFEQRSTVLQRGLPRPSKIPKSDSSMNAVDELINKELELICNSNELGIRKFQIITYKIFDSEGMLREKYYINGSIDGPIRKILVMNEYVKGRIECDNLRLTFH